MTEINQESSFSGWTCDDLTPNLCDLNVTEGNIPIQDDGLFVHYWKYSIDNDDSNPKDPPIVVVHGGPGMPHNYMLPIKQLACRPGTDGRYRDVYFYDQGGCGQSVHPVRPVTKAANKLVEDFPFLLDPQYYATVELPRILDHLGLSETGYHLVANSWGTILAQYFVINTPAKGLESMVLSGPLSDGDLYVRSQWASEQDGGYNNLGELPPFLQQRIHSLEARKLYDSLEYQAIDDALTGHFTSRVVPPPDCFRTSVSPEKGMNPDVYVGIQGPSEFTLGGVLEGFNTTDHLSSVVVPVALTSGAYDTMRPPVVDALYRALPNSEWSMSRVSGHVTMIDDAGWTNDIIHDFLSRVEDSGVFVPDPTRCGPKDCLPKHSMTRNHHISNEVILFLSLVLGIAIGRLLPFSAHRREGYETVV